MSMFTNLLIALLLMLGLLFAVALLGGVGNVELSIWAALLAVVLTVVVVRTRRQTA